MGRLLGVGEESKMLHMLEGMSTKSHLPPRKKIESRAVQDTRNAEIPQVSARRKGCDMQSSFPYKRSARTAQKHTCPE